MVRKLETGSKGNSFSCALSLSHTHREDEWSYFKNSSEINCQVTCSDFVKVVVTLKKI